MSAGSPEEYWISFSSGGVLISRTASEAVEPLRQRRSSTEISGLLDQLLSEGYAESDAAGALIPWDSLYSLLGDSNYASSTHLLALPPETPVTLRLTSKGSLADTNFQILIAGGIDENRTPVTFAGLKGGVVQIGRDLTLLGQSAWRLAELVGTFYRRSQAERNESYHRRQWGVIRRAAVEAHAEMSDFLQRTVVLTPDKLQIKLRKTKIGDTMVVEVTPSFEGAPAEWLNAFDNSPRISDRYDISAPNGVVQILTTPEIRSVLGEIKRFQNRRIAGARAEAFLLNPLSTLGSDAVKVLDEEQFAEAKSEAGIAFDRFRPHVVRNVVGYPSEVGIDIDQADGSAERRLFQDDVELADFVSGLERRISRGQQIYGWQGYEFELWGDAQGALAELQAALNDRQKLRIDISREQVYDLNQYSERIAEIGQDKLYISTYIVKRADEGGWFPDICWSV